MGNFTPRGGWAMEDVASWGILTPSSRGNFLDCLGTGGDGYVVVGILRQDINTEIV